MEHNELVERITREVVAALQKMGTVVPQGPQAVSAASSSRCGAGSFECHGCGQCVTRRETEVQRLVEAGAARVTTGPGGTPSGATLARMIDHTLLKPDAKEPEIRKLCEEAARHKFASVCVNPGWVRLCAELLKGSGVMVCTVVGFPLGATSTASKAFETSAAVADGADEIDMVLNIGALKAGNTRLVEDDIRAVVNAAHGHTVKVIFETSLLTDEEKVTASILSKKAGAHFVKTSTGFGGGGATAADIALMRKTVGPEMGVKASGGVRDLKTALQMIEAGANRIGASASVAIVTGAQDKGKGY